MTALYIVFQSCLQLLALIGFISGFFLDLRWMMICGGIILCVLDAIAITTGALNPLCPVIFAVILAFIMTPWYAGVFWSIAVFKLLDIPCLIKHIVDPARAVEEIRQKTGGSRDGRLDDV